jgi:hypothetical protein
MCGFWLELSQYVSAVKQPLTQIDGGEDGLKGGASSRMTILTRSMAIGTQLSKTFSTPARRKTASPS